MLKDQGYQQRQLDHIMFFNLSKNGLKTILIVYVDDIILTGDDLTKIKRLKKILVTEFEVRDLGKMCYFLGMEIVRSKRGISVFQRIYVVDLLMKIGMIRGKLSDTLIEAGK